MSATISLPLSSKKPKVWIPPQANVANAFSPLRVFARRSSKVAYVGDISARCWDLFMMREGVQTSESIIGTLGDTRRM